MLHLVKNQNTICRTYGELNLMDMLHWNKRHLFSDTQVQGLGDQAIKKIHYVIKDFLEILDAMMAR